MRMVILREGAHLGRHFRRIVAQHVADHQRVGYAVRQVVICAELVRHRVADAKNALANAMPAMQDASAIFWRAPGRPRHIRRRAAGNKHILHRLERQAVGVIRRHHRGIGFQTMRQHVDAPEAEVSPRGWFIMLSASTIAMFGSSS